MKKTMIELACIVSAPAASATFADVPLPEPDLTYYGSVSVNDVLIETEDPITKYRVRATLATFTLDTYRMFSNTDADIAGVPQYLLHIPMEYVTLLPSGEAVVLGDEINIHVESCTSNCDESVATWTEAYTETHTACTRGTVTLLDLPIVIPCPLDFDMDGIVGFSDILSILAGWGPCDCCPQDYDMDGMVGFSDLLAVLAASGPCP